MMRSKRVERLYKATIFFVGWVLSPFTWWNDAFINIPLSYLLANGLFYITHIRFAWLVLGSYWVTNAIGLLFMYIGGKHLIVSSRNRLKTAFFMMVFLLAYSIVMVYLDRHGMLVPLGGLFEHYHLLHK